MYVDPVLQNKTKLYNRKQRYGCVVICIVKRSEKDTVIQGHLRTGVGDGASGGGSTLT